MKSTNKKTFSVVSVLIAGIMISVAATKPTASAIIIKDAASSDTGIFKNLQVLPKDISKDSLDTIMHHFTKALGVRCNFCHAMGNGKMDFASDEKEEKGIARYMIKMAAGINTTYFNFEKSNRPDTINVVKCITCHHGYPHPDEAEMKKDSSQEHHDMSPLPPQSDSSKPNNQ
jgi:photosynthetic reaction center cytochrome c subunit